MQFGQLKRRQLITLLGGAAAAWPLVARGQQRDRMRRIGVLINLSADDAEAQTRNAAFLQGLAELGRTVGRNVVIYYRFAGGDADRIRRYAAELVALAPDVVMATGGVAVAALLQATSTIPIVFVNVIDPVASGFAATLSRPSGNATGFTLYEFGTAGKWLELLKQIAPRVARVAVLRNPAVQSALGQVGAIQAAAPSFGVELSLIDARDAGEIERAVTAFARSSNGGLIVLVSGLGGHRNLLITLAAQHRLPAAYPFSYYVRAGGLISYAPDSVEQYRRAASYVDRILKGEKPADLPVQAPTKYELAINLKTAKTLDLTVPPTLLALADEVIE
jgi:putative ABC transport system substrate-binding protein